MTATFEKLEQRLAAAAADGYSPLSEADVRAFEIAHSVQLPVEYRRCLVSVSNGAPGLFRLGEIDDGWETVRWQEGNGLVGTLATSFPHTAEWNDLGGMPSDDYDESDPEACSSWERAREAFEGRYWAPLDGAVPIAHVGCGIRHWLVISGPSAGQVWEDDRANCRGLYPLQSEGAEPMSYCQWLDWQTSSGPAA
jgi:hypothetical protein